ncbi:MAG: O-antigen ligase family protein [Candidatus Desulfaltia sp.]|nr:O-antigen ligase family protein [Candidatus Desulfaltia sp.]
MEINTTTDTVPQFGEQSIKEKIFKILSLSVPVLMGIFLFFVPFPHTTAIKEICFYGSIFIVLILICVKKIDFSFKSPLTFPFMLFVAWAFIGLFFALDKGNSIHDFRAHLLKYIVFYYILINSFNSRKRLIGLSWVIIISATIFSIGEIYYFYFMLGNSFSAKLVTGLPEIPVNWVGYITVTAAIFSLHHIITASNLYVKTISFISLFPLCILSVLTQARSTVLALFLSVIILCFKNKKILIACLGIILIAIAMTPLKNRFIHVNPITSLRFDINYMTFEIIKDFPIIGIGFGMETYKNGKHINLEEYNKKVPEKYRQSSIHNDPHSMLPSIAVRTGLVGLALFVYILFISFKMCWDCIRNGKDDFIKRWGRCVAAVFVVVIVIGNFEPFFSHVPEVVLYTSFAMMTILWRLNKADPL